MNINEEINHAKYNVLALRRLLKTEREKLRQLKFNRKMRDKRRK